jgi:DNA-directed RNA polymerase subunit RPC12/RpoP
LLPCSNCGAELSGAEDTTTVVERDDFEFQGEPTIQELPAKVCPECEHVTPL